jgi:hypothetical protein
MVRRADEPRPLVWRGTWKIDFMAFPSSMPREMGYGCLWRKWVNAIQP